MKKILYETPIVEMQGDEMTRILWDWIKEILIDPFVRINTEFYDLGLESRDETNDEITLAAAEACKRLKVGVKCATITPNNQRLEEYKLKKLYASPNGTIRAALDGTVFRAPIIVKGINPLVSTWKTPITIARHAYGDVYKGSEMVVDANTKAEILLTHANGEIEKKSIFDFTGGGVIQGTHNTDKSIESFARACFSYGINQKQDVWFGTKDTISKLYDGRFKDIFQSIYENEYSEQFKANGIEYMYTLIDDCVARIMRSSGGMIWACKNYDGDVMSDMLGSSFGSLAMMSSVLVSPDGVYEYEAAHGTVTRHYYKYREGGETSTNPVATIFAWSGAFRRRGELEDNQRLIKYANRLEKATLETIASGQMTGDLVSMYSRKGITAKKLNSKEFLYAVQEKI